MKIIILRHAIAERREVFKSEGKPDYLRPLTNKGRKRMDQIMSGIAGMIPRVDLILTSPWVRAGQTAKIFQTYFADTEIQELDELIPDRSPSDLFTWLKNCAHDMTIAVVGHEPYLSHLVSFLTTGSAALEVELKKGAMCIVEFGSGIEIGKAKMLCLCQPSVLRKIT